MALRIGRTNTCKAMFLFGIFLMRPEWRLSVERDQLSGMTCESTGHMVNNDQSYLKRVR
jgi:hypothetical protein